MRLIYILLLVLSFLVYAIGFFSPKPKVLYPHFPLLEEVSVKSEYEKDFWRKRYEIINSEVSLKELDSVEKECESYVLEQQRMEESQIKKQKRLLLEPNITITRDPTIQNATNPTFRLPLPLMDLETVGLSGRWEERADNFILRPPEGKIPVGVIHFLGGAFFGAAPHITYRYLLDALSEAGYVVVATPYRLEFDYMNICDKILNKFDKVAFDLAAEYGPVPVIGLGHSCGALLQTLITCLFPDAPRAANILISFNNKPVTGSIPLFEEIVMPLSKVVMSDNDQSKNFRETLVNIRKLFDESVDAYKTNTLITPKFMSNELIPLLKQSLEILDQVPDVIKSIAKGQAEYNPSPLETREVCRRMYRARRTLLLKFENDILDESDDIQKVLREANTIMRMKRPMIEMQCEMKVLTGTHLTPLYQNIFIEPPSTLSEFDILGGVRTQVKSNFLKTIDDVKTEILTWLDSSMTQS